MIMCYYHYSCIELIVALVNFQVGVCNLRLHHDCQGEYVILNDIDFDGVERKIFCDCVDKLLGGRKL